MPNLKFCRYYQTGGVRVKNQFMQSYRKATPEEFDAVVHANSVRDEHDFLESRYIDSKDRVIAKVVRYLDEDDELIPEADLRILEL